MNKTKTRRLRSAFVCAGLLFGVVHTVRPALYEGAMIQIPLEHVGIVLSALEQALETRAPRPGVNPANPALPVGSCDSAELASIAECVCAIKGQVISCCSVIDNISSRVDILITGSLSCSATSSQLDSCCSVIENISSMVDTIITSSVNSITVVVSQLDSCCSVIENISSMVDTIITSSVNSITVVVSQLDSCCSVIDNISSVVDSLITSSVNSITVVVSQLDQCCSIIENNIGNLGDTGSCLPVIATIADIDNANLDVIQWLKTIMYELRGVC